jgi:hypothetical protein
MPGRSGRWPLIVVVLLASACTRISDERATGTWVLAHETLKDSTSVPKAWGNLIAATSGAESPGVYRLWFQDAEGNVRVVGYNNSRRFLGQNVTLITRK